MLIPHYKVTRYYTEILAWFPILPIRTLETVGPFKTALKTYLHSIQWLSQAVSHAAPL